jgi:DNA polymerase I
MRGLDFWLNKENPPQKEKTEENFIVTHIDQNEDIGKTNRLDSNKLDVITGENGDSLYVLLSADYEPQMGKVYLKFYDVNRKKIFIWYDTTGHKPYAYTKEDIDKIRNHPEIMNISDKIVDLKEETKYDPIIDQEIKVTKIIVKDPLVIGGTRYSLREKMRLWEADIKYYANYIFDMGLQVGGYYVFDAENGLPKPYSFDYPPEVSRFIENIGDEEIVRWIKLLSMDIPDYKRVALDIEVYNPAGVMPRVEDPKYPVFVASLRGSEGLRKIIYYDLRNELKEKIFNLDGYEVEVVNSEEDLIKRVIEIIREYPIIITFNGDKFDLPYIRKRGEVKGIPNIGDYIRLGRNDARITWGIHLDLYEFFKNVSIKTYAFSNAYDIVSLDTVAQALIGKGKVQMEKGFQESSAEEILRYAYMDAEITYELTTFNNNVVLRLITMIARIANMTIDDVCRLSISRWIKNRLVSEHRRKGYLIPLPEEIVGKGGRKHLEPITKGKKYAGALVIEPIPGIHFNVHVVDFASLYPSLMKEYNISYETVNCPHEECKDNKVPETTTWICKKKKGIISTFTGAIRDVRVMVFKKLSKDRGLPPEKRAFYEVAQGALKVFINAMYGVTGAETFPFYYLPAAEAVTLLGRYSINTSISTAKKMKLEVVYGDTDSLFIKNPDKKTLNHFMKEVEKKLRLKLEIDKIYRYVVLSNRKKNYFGVLEDGSIDVKGLLGKKSSTPPFIKNIFYDVLEILRNINSQDEFDEARIKIQEMIVEAERKLRKGEVSLEDLAISVTLSKPLKAYTKTTPQHVKAARKLERVKGIEIPPGTIIKIIKTKDSDGAAPLELVKSLHEVDTEKYVELLRSTLEQILDVLDIDLDKIRISREYRSLDQYFNF